MEVIIRVLLGCLISITLFSCSSDKKEKEPTNKRMYLKGLGFVNGPFKEIKETIDGDNKGNALHLTYQLDTTLRILTKTNTDNGKKEYIYFNRDYRADSSVEETPDGLITSVYWSTPFYDDKVLYCKTNNIKMDSFYYKPNISNRTIMVVFSYSAGAVEQVLSHYDKEGFLVGLTNITKDSTVNSKSSYRYDSNGNMIWQRFEGKESGYESNARHWGYDAKGNWTKKEEEFSSFPSGVKQRMMVSRKITY